MGRARQDLGYVAGRAQNTSAISDDDQIRRLIATVTVPDRLFGGGIAPSGVRPVAPVSIGSGAILIQPFPVEDIGNFR